MAGQGRHGTLSRLQAIDKDAKGLEHRLQALVDVLGSPELLTDQITTPGQARTADGRLDWALRWTLKQLGESKTDDQGRIARSSPQCWTLLTNLLSTLHHTPTIRALQASSILAIVQKTLTENFIGVPVAPPYHESDDEEHDEYPNGIGTFTVPIFRPEKRKRETTQYEVEVEPPLKRILVKAVNSRTGNDNGDHILRLYVALRRFLDVLVGMQGLSTVLSGFGHTDFAQLLGSWIVACDTMLSVRSRSIAIDECSLSSALKIWYHRRPTNIGNADTADFVYSCLGPIMIMLHHMKDIRSHLKKGDARLLHSEHLIRALERALAEHLLLPLKRMRPGQSGLEDDEYESTMFRLMTTPLLRSNIATAPALPELMALAIRCTPMSTPRKRISESPWLERLFLVLAKYLDCEPSKTSIDKDEARDYLNTITYHAGEYTEIRKLAEKAENIQNQNLEHLEATIMLLSKHNVKLSQDTRSGLMRNYALKGEGRWTLIAELVKMDPILVINHEDILSKLFKLTRIAPDHRAKDQEYSMKRDRVLLPLLKALISARSFSKFTGYWYTELTATFKAYLIEEGEAREEETRHLMWEDATLVNALGQVEASLTLRQLKELFDQFLSQITKPSTSSRAKSQDELAALAASLSITNSLLLAIRQPQNLQALMPDLVSTLEKVLQILRYLELTETLVRGRLWQSIAIFHRCISSVMSGEDFERASTTTIPVIDKLAKKVLKEASKEKTQFAEVDHLAYESLEVLRCLASLFGDLKARSVDTVPSTSVSQMKGLLLHIAESTPPIQIEMLTKLLAENPVLLLSPGVSPSPEKAAVDSALFKDWLKNRGEMDTALNLWEALVCWMTEEQTSKISRGEINVVPRLPEYDQYPVLHLLRNSAQTPIQSVHLGSIEKLDAVTASLIYNDRRILGSADIAAALSYLIRFLPQCHNPRKAALLTAPNSIVTIAKTLDHHIHRSPQPEDDEVMLPPLLYRLCQIIMEFQLEHKDEEISKRYIKAGAREYTSGLHNMTDNLRTHLGTLAWLKAIVETPLAQLLFSVDNDSICTQLCASITNMSKENKKTRNTHAAGVAAAIDVLCAMEIVIVARQKAALKAIVNNKKLANTEDDHDSVKTRLFMLECRIKLVEALPPDLEKAMSLLSTIKTTHSARIIEDSVVRSIAAASSDARHTILLCLLPPSIEDATVAVYDTRKLHILHLLIRASTTKPYRELLPTTLLTTITTSLLVYLPQTIDLKRFKHIAASLHYLLTTHGSHLKQLTIESTLSTIIAVCSPATAPTIPPTQVSARVIFTSMVKLMQTLLMSHRQRLGGRFDILVLALQSLLRCMFVPASGPSTFGALALPSWLPRKHAVKSDGDDKSERGIDAECVGQFARLLTNICDPTAVRSSSKNKNGAPLTDETKKAKRYAGQYMRYLLMELCECQLKGRMVEGGREALSQGVWSVMDVIGREGLDVVGEGMQGGGRSVLRGYWEEWRGVRGRGRR